MAIKIGTIDVAGVAVGETSIGSVAVGSNVVWQKVLPDPLCFTGQPTDMVRMVKVGNPDAANIEYSKDGSTWTAYTFGTWIAFDGADNKVYFRAASDNNTSFYTDASNYYKFELDENYPTTVSGNLDTLLNKNGTRHATKAGTYRELFIGMSGLKDASQLELPSMTLPTLCYYGMFQNCNGLSAAPELPATTVAASCYRSMFEGCTSLKSSPSVLPATTTQQYCYSRMFYGCTAITDAPAISATTLTTNCFQNMFSIDTNLSSVTVAFDDWNSSVTPTSYWLYNVAASGKFYCPSELSVIRGASNIPTNWAVNPPAENPYTSVSYTSASGLPDWEGDIVGEITPGGDGIPTKLIPNVGFVQELSIGSHVTSIGDHAFGDCPNITSVTIPDSVLSIGGQAFYYCRGITELTIPGSVTSIDYGAFGSCNGLTSVTFEGFTKNEVKTMTSGSQKIFGERFIDTSTGEEMEKSFTAVCSDGSMTIHFSADWESVITFTDL